MRPATTIDELFKRGTIADEPDAPHLTPEPTMHDLLYIAFWSADPASKAAAVLSLAERAGMDRMEACDAMLMRNPETTHEVHANAVVARLRQSEFGRRVEASAGSNVCETDV